MEEKKNALGRIEDEKQTPDSIYQHGKFPCAKCGEMTLWTQLVVMPGHTFGDGTGICTRCFGKKREERGQNAPSSDFRRRKEKNE